MSNRFRAVLGRTVLIVALAMSFLTPAAIVARHDALATQTGVHQIGFMPYGFVNHATGKMAVDPGLHRGFFSAEDGNLYVFDLVGLHKVGAIPIPQIGSSFAIDPVRHRIFYRSSAPAVRCADSKIIVIDAKRMKASTPNVPCYGPDAESFYVRGISYYAPSNKVYVIGSTASEAVAVEASGANAYRESTIIRQLNADTLALDWEVDASRSCDTNTNIASAADPVVARAKRGVISYCYQAGQGRAIWIPIEHEGLVAGSDGNKVVNVSPTIGRTTTPIIDAASGRLLILEDQPPFGPGVYVYDPEAERFYGIVPSGVTLESNGIRFDYWRGFSPDTGRLYIQNRTGLVIADIRSNPLPAGVSYPVLVGRKGGPTQGPIAIDPGLHRLFYAYPDTGFAVLEDDVPLPPSIAPDDPDSGTANVAEAPGATDRTFSAASSAFGVHVINVGGLPRIVDNADTLCTSVGTNDRDQYGRCPLDQVITPGNREFFLAQSLLEAGSDSGTTGSAAIERTPSSDNATDSDIRALSQCEIDRFPMEAQMTIKNTCPNGDGQLLADLSNGTRGSNGKGYPVSGASCSDFEGKPETDPGPSEAFGTATASCDSTKHHALSLSRASGAQIGTSSSAALVTVAETTSSVETMLTDHGVETKAIATASGVVIGGTVTIGRIETTATTQAKGRDKTTVAEYTVDFSDVRAPNLKCVQCSPAAVADAINRAFGAQMRARAPSPYKLASPHGYQGVVSKDLGLLASDRAVNDDDTITVNALDLVFYNDSNPANRTGSAGRSRVLVSLAGVEAESRYGIFLLPSSTDGVYNPGSSSGTDTPTVSGPAPKVLGEHLTAPSTSAGIQNVGGGAVGIVNDAFAFVRTRPREAGMLFVLWSLFAAPVYMGIRRRALARALDA